VRVANTVELKNKTNELLRHVTSGDPVIITLWGKPAAALTRLTEADLEAFVLEHAPRHDRDTMRFTGPYRYLSLSSPLGTVYVAYSDRGVCAVDLAGSDATFARAFRQRFIAIFVIQVENRARSSKPPRARHAARKVSCVRSAAASRSPTIR